MTHPLNARLQYLARLIMEAGPEDAQDPHLLDNPLWFIRDFSVDVATRQATALALGAFYKVRT